MVAIPRWTPKLAPLRKRYEDEVEALRGSTASAWPRPSSR